MQASSPFIRKRHDIGNISKESAPASTEFSEFINNLEK